MIVGSTRKKFLAGNRFLSYSSNSVSMASSVSRQYVGFSKINLRATAGITAMAMAMATTTGRTTSTTLVWKRAFFSSSSSKFSGASGSSTNSSKLLDSFFKYNISIAYQPKDRDSEQKGTFFQQQGKNLGSSLSPTGEDNYVIGFNNLENSIIIGVADGVGGWSELGYDSSYISRELCEKLKKFFEIGNYNGDNKKLLESSFNEILKEEKVQVGGTTICFGTINSKGKLDVTNLGDSWFGVFRPIINAGNNRDIRFNCIFQSKEQTHGFNTPYQLSIIPKSILEASEAQGKRYIQDKPSDAQDYQQFNLQKGDIIMFATDGVTDNVCTDDISNFLTDEFNENKVEDETSLLKINKHFVTKVNKLSRDHKYPSVFAQELSKLTGQAYTGGKYDDITVVMVQVS
ncbi:hypothetical protein PACTADRAFT_49899 [Pachysolen tannophilus NRRL Y-2460]|uniref:Protein phosphatase n=1 Tax=Pachysolen tannophilus NRRL Y-2460 TaxID=669874 RepID=A0A1E4TTT3_PACTA|nr:hypothetical protein PACTADRAFT_49899 [Pachysolen tannophilus NRRL Y-2460]